MKQTINSLLGISFNLSFEWTASMIWAVLEPGAAHMSSTHWWGLMSMRRGGTILTASCLLILPYIPSCINITSCHSKYNIATYSLGFCYHESVKLLEFGWFLDYKTRSIDLPTKVVRIPGQWLRRFDFDTVNDNILHVRDIGLFNDIQDLHSSTIQCK